MFQLSLELLRGEPFPINLLNSVGTPTIILNLTKKKGQKFDSKGEEGKLIGFNFALQSYRIVVPSGRIIESKHVKFLRNPDLLPTTASDCDQLLEFQPPTQSVRQEQQSSRHQEPSNHR